MRKITNLFVMMFLLANLPALGCDDGDDDNENTNDGGLDSGGDGGDGGDDGGGVVECGKDGACCEPSDWAAVNATNYGTGGNATYRDVAFSCALSCSSKPEDEMCPVTCLADATDNAASEDCSACYLQTITCGKDHCLAVCGTDPTSTKCAKCRCGDNDADKDCVAEFITCSGVPSDSCEGL